MALKRKILKRRLVVRGLCSLAPLLPGTYAAIATVRGVITTTLAFICFECLSILV